MQKTSLPNPPKVEHDTRLFMWIMTLVVAGMAVTTLIEVPAIRQPIPLAVFLALVITHITLHWFLEKITARQSSAIAYIAIQGILAFIISWLASSLGMIFALFMGLLGEAVGMFGLTRKGFLAGGYYIILLIINLVQLSGWSQSGLVILSLIPMAFFVVLYVTLYMRQIDAREYAQTLAAELETANRQLTEYAAQVEDLTIINERQRMARELHDTLSQGLAGLILQLEAADAHLANSRPEKARTIVQQTMEHARTTLTDARRAIGDLRQTDIRDLENVLRLEISRFESATGIPCAFHAEPTPPIPDTVKETTIRAVAESLTNIARHAQAKTASVKLTCSENEMQVKIKDDGKGFDPQSIPNGHYGILGIKERVRITGGKLQIESTPASGTTITISFPIS